MNDLISLQDLNYTNVGRIRSVVKPFEICSTKTDSLCNLAKMFSTSSNTNWKQKEYCLFQGMENKREHLYTKCVCVILIHGKNLIDIIVFEPIL